MNPEPRTAVGTSFVDDAVAGRLTLPMLPQVILDLLRELRREDCSLHRVGALIERDPVLSARILRMANTSYFGGRRSIDSLPAAVAMIGSQPLVTLLVACGAQAAFAEVRGANLRQFWVSAQATAGAARLIAQRLGADREAAYSAGLLQPVGHLILCQWAPEQAERHFSRMFNPWGAALARAEEEAFGISHPRVSALWVDRLGLPARVVEAIGASMSTPEARVPPLARCVQLACELAAALSGSLQADDLLARLPPALLLAAGLPDYARDGGLAEDLDALAALPAEV